MVLESDDEPETGSRSYQRPFCCACGVLVSDEEYLQTYNVYCKGRRIALHWTSNYRAIIREQSKPASGKKNFRLSGVSRFRYRADTRPLVRGNLSKGRVFRVPRDRKDTITRRRHITGEDESLHQRTMAVYPANFWETRNQDFYPHGFPIHAHCWSMIERVIGQSAENEVDLFLEVLHQRWKMKPRPFELGKCVVRRSWEGCCYEENINVELGALWDPVNIPAIQCAIRRSTLRPPTRPSTSPQHLGGFNLPLDIIFQMLDYLQVTDVDSLLDATCWQVPDSYWRSRFPRKLIFEAEELISEQAENLDWEFLTLEVEWLLEDPPLGIRNRQRIFRILEGTKELFHSRLLN